VRLFGGVMGEFIKALEVMDLGFLNHLLLNFLDQAFQHPNPHPELFHTKGCDEASEKIDMDLNVLKPLGSVLGTFPELVQVFFEVINLTGPSRVFFAFRFSPRHVKSPLPTLP